MFDIFDDGGALLKAVYPTQESMPHWVRDCGLPGQDGLSKLASYETALVANIGGRVRHLWPTVDPGSTHISCMYFENTHQNLPDIEMQKHAAKNLMEACTRFGLQPTEKVAELSTEYHDKSASANVSIPFPEQGIPGTSLFPLSTVEHVKTASDNLLMIMRKLDPSDRRVFGMNLAKQAGMFGVETPDVLEKWAGSRVDYMALTDALEQRIGRLEDREVANNLRKFANDIAYLPPEEAAQCLYTLDEKLGMDQFWDKGVRDPYSIFGEEKTSNSVVKVASIEMDRDTWESACDAGIFEGYLDKDVSDALRSNPEVLENYAGTPIEGWVVDRLSDLGIVR